MVHMPKPSAMTEGPRTTTPRRVDKSRRGPRRPHVRRMPSSRPNGTAGIERYCPICDQVSDEVICRRHGVQTIPARVLDGPTSQFVPGTIVGGAYRIEGRLGEGAMGSVFRATQLSVDRPVALKFLSAVQPRDKEELRRFFREAYVASRLEHPNVVQIVEFGVDDRTSAPFIAMKLVPGENLGEVLRREGPLAPARAARIVAQVARALAAAHSLALVHRDLKPANLMITLMPNGEEHVTVIDFGVAKSVRGEQSDAALSRSGVVVGTPMYMSPEQATGRPIDARTDLYALGCLLFEMLTGAAPPLRLCATGIAPGLSTDVLQNGSPEFSARLDRLCRALLAPCPTNRPQDATIVAAELEALSVDAPTQPLTPAPKASRFDDAAATTAVENYALMQTLRRRKSR